MMDKKQVNDVLRQNVALMSKQSDREVGMMTAMTQVPVLVLDLRLTIRTRPLL